MTLLLAKINRFLLVQGINPIMPRGSVGGDLLSVVDNPKLFNFDLLSGLETWGVYAAGPGLEKPETIFYPVVVVHIDPIVNMYEFYINFNGEEKTLKLTFKMIKGAVRFYLGQMLRSGTFEDIYTSARIRVKPVYGSAVRGGY